MEDKEVIDTTETSAENATTTVEKVPEATPATDNATVQPMCDTFYLRFSKTCTPFKLPLYPEIAHVAELHFKDPAINVTYERFRGEKIYCMETTENHALDQSLTFTVENKVYKIKLDPKRSTTKFARRGKQDQRSNNEDGLLLTFYQAGRKFLNNVPNSVFDQVLQNALGLELLKITEKQRIKNTPLFNGNRFAVVKRPDNLAVIPESIPITDPLTKRVFYIKINYWGQLVYCSRCMIKHGRKCPELEAFYAAKEAREAMRKNNEIASKIMSDSTLRHADALGLKADILCMSGGSIGQVVQAAFDDPEAVDKDIIVVAGANDVKNDNFDSEEEYAESIQQAMNKVIELAEVAPDRDITIVTCDPIPTEPTEEMDEMDCHEPQPEVELKKKVRREYIHIYVDDFVNKVKKREKPLNNVHTMKASYETDNSGHPTIKGTDEILQQINKHIDQKLIWNDNFITSNGLYRGVESVFRYGCGACVFWGEAITHETHYNPNICDKCVEIIKENATESGYPLLELAIHTTEPSEDEQTGGKRTVEEELDENTSKKLKGQDGYTSPEEAMEQEF